MPPATMTWLMPAASMSCANIAAFMPEPHILLTVVAPVASGKPPPMLAWRAGAWPWPAGSTQPITTSCTCSGLMPARSTAARIAAAPSCGAEKSFSSPWNAPMGVLAAETITIGSFIMATSRSFGSPCFGKELAPYEPAADLGRPCPDLVELGVAPQPPGRGFVDVTHAAQALDGFARHPGGLLGCVEDRAGGVLAGGLAAVERLPDRVDVSAARGERRVHVGELALHQLELADRLAELLALVHVGHDDVEAGRHDAQRPAREHRALVIQARHQDFHALRFLAEHVLGGNFAVAEHQLAGVRPAHAELVQLLRGGESPHPFFDNESGDRFRGLAVDHQNVGIRTVGDPHLVAVEDVAVAPAVRAQAHPHDVGSRSRLGHRERAHRLPRHQLRQIALLLCCAPVPADLVDAQVGMGAVR